MSSSRPRFQVERSSFAFTARRPVAILMVVLAVGVFGWVCYSRLALTLMPEMTYPTLSVRTSYPGTAPEEIENVISRPLEQELGIIPRLSSISSISKAGQSDVILEFQWNTDMDLIAQEIREKVDRIRLPNGAERPLLLHYDPSLDPILRLGLAGPQSLYDLRHLAEYEIKRKIESIDGVAAARVKGGLEEEFLVALDEGKLSVLKLDINQIGQRLAQGNVNLPGGNLREGQTEYLIRTLNEFRTLEEIGEVIVTRQSAVDIRLRDIASITRFHKDREIITRVNGRESVEIEIYKEADANIVAVATAVKAALFGRPDQQAYLEAEAKGSPKKSVDRTLSGAERRRLEAQERQVHQQMTDFVARQLPVDTTLELLSDQSTFIGNSIDEVKSNAFFGALIAVVVLFVFLRNLAHTLIIAVAIPISIVATFAPMYLAGVSLNIISLGGLALGVGMLVDNAIVVLESIFRCREEGDDLVTGVVRGVGEVGMAVVASTLTTVAVFLPIVFVEGVAGQVFGDMALTVVFSLLASLAAALFFVPMLASRQFGATAQALSSGFSQSDFLRLPPARLRSPLDVLQRLGRVGAVFSAFTLKLVLSLALGTVRFVPFLALRPQPWSRPRWLGRGIEWLSADSVGPIQAGWVWPGLLRMDALAHLESSLAAWLKWSVPSRRNLLVLRSPAALIALVFLIARFVAELALRLLGVGFQLAVMALAVLALGSLRLVSALLIPVTASSLNAFDHGYRALQDAYPRLIMASLRHRFTILGGALIAFVLCWWLILPRIGRELIPQVHQGEFNLDVTLPIGTPLERTAELAGRIEDVVVRQPEVERTALTAGAEDTATTASEAGEHTARITVKLKPDLDGGTEAALIERIREKFSSVPELSLEISYPALFSVKSPIEVEIRGHDLALLKRTSREAEAAMSQIPGLVDLRSTLQSGNPEIQVLYHRDRLAEYGLSLRSVAEIVRNKVQGSIATEFRRDDRMIDIVVRLREEDRFGVEELRRLIVNPGGAVAIPLSAVADFVVNEGPSEVRRIDQQRAALITANVDGIDLATASEKILTALSDLSLPAGFSYVVAGQNEEMARSLNSLLLAFALALFLVYIVMASQFESLLQPLLIMLTVPLALIGVLIALWLGGVSISIMVFLGLIILAGIVVNNAIILIDYINTLRARGIDKTTAIVEAGRARLRPILMTTLTTVLGLLPMAMGFGEGAEIRAPMAITVIVGLSVSTLLTLVIIPTVYHQFVGAIALAPDQR